ncbi:MAG: hypothetical protein FRX49_05267 [Trebouxia sp. A1-2]|nr:MAG: hypothetical protein FRX49_05267 [Trebouxia sp. A1-2]
MPILINAASITEAHVCEGGYAPLAPAGLPVLTPGLWGDAVLKTAAASCNTGVSGPFEGLRGMALVATLARFWGSIMLAFFVGLARAGMGLRLKLAAAAAAMAASVSSVMPAMLSVGPVDKDKLRVSTDQG